MTFYSIYFNIADASKLKNIFVLYYDRLGLGNGHATIVSDIVSETSPAASVLVVNIYRQNTWSRSNRECRCLRQYVSSVKRVYFIFMQLSFSIAMRMNELNRYPSYKKCDLRPSRKVGGSLSYSVQREECLQTLSQCIEIDVCVHLCLCSCAMYAWWQVKDIIVEINGTLVEEWNTEKIKDILRVYEINHTVWY